MNIQQVNLIGLGAVLLIPHKKKNPCVRTARDMKTLNTTLALSVCHRRKKMAIAIALLIIDMIIIAYLAKEKEQETIDWDNLPEGAEVVEYAPGKYVVVGADNE